MKKISLFTLYLLLATPLWIGAQNNPSFQESIGEANNLIHQQEYEKAIEKLEPLLSSTNSDELFSTRYYLGYAYHLQQNYTQALLHYDEALKLNDSNLYLLETVGDLYLSLKLQRTYH